jgi:hypothetical protein
VEIVGQGRGKPGERWKIDFIAGLLNDERPDVPGSDRPGIPWGILHAPDVAKTYPSNVIRRADAQFTKLLRTLVDRWIDSGRNAEGIESPPSRDVKAVLAGHSETLFDLLQKWLERNRPLPTLTGPSGRIFIGLHMPRFHGRNRKPEFYARECAFYWFQQLLDSPFCFHVSRCSNPECRRYYFRNRLRKAEIKRGAYCGNCFGAGSVERTRRSREARKKNLVSLAADAWSAWKPARRGLGRQSDWVARNMNRKLRSDLRITGKWVSQNRKTIEAEVERRSNAKG